VNIYLVQRADLNAVGYDEWDSIVVIAESQEAAFEIHPSFWVGERYYPHQGWGCGPTGLMYRSRPAGGGHMSWLRVCLRASVTASV